MQPVRNSARDAKSEERTADKTTNVIDNNWPVDSGKAVKHVDDVAQLGRGYISTEVRGTKNEILKRKQR